MSAIVARRCYVSGRVQGVFYRASARQKAATVGCSGYARNLPDGRVEVLAVGDSSAVQALVDWLWQGSPGAYVTNVEVIQLDPLELGELPAGFATR